MEYIGGRIQQFLSLLLDEFVLNRGFERYYPYYWAFATCVAMVIVTWLIGTPQPNKAIYGMAFIATFTTAGISVGFLGTTTSVLIGLNSKTMRSIRNSSAINDLIAYLRDGIMGSFLVMAIAFLGFFMTPPFDDRLEKAVVIAWFSGLVFLLAALYRIAYILLGLVAEHPVEEN